MGLPEKCGDIGQCRSPKRQGCTMKAMQNHLRGKGIPGLWKLNKASLCQVYANASRNGGPRPPAPNQIPNPKSKPKSKSKPEPKPEPEPKSKSKPEPEPEPKSKSKPEPEELANPGKYIWNDVKYLSGPISATVFEISKGRRIYIFGDSHDSKRGQCWSRSSESIQTVFRRLCGDRSRDIDVFLEYGRENPFRYGGSSPLIDILQEYTSESESGSRTSKRCAARFHWADVRNEFSWLGNMDVPEYGRAFYSDFVRHIDSAAKLRRLLDGFLTNKNWKREIFTLWPTFRMDQRDAVKDNFSTGKEFNRLGSTHQALLREFIDDYIQHDDMMSERYYGNFIASVRRRGWNRLSYYYLDLLILNVGLIVMDVYLLSRLLRYVEKQKTNGISVIFCGEAHCINYVRFLQRLYGPPVFHRASTDFMRNLKSYRCIDVRRSMPVQFEYNPKPDFWWAWVKRPFA